jgi:hypothetical protein
LNSTTAPTPRGAYIWSATTPPALAVVYRNDAQARERGLSPEERL